LSLQAEFDENCLKGILDQLILIQKQEVGTDDPVMDDDAIRGTMLNFIVGGELQHNKFGECVILLTGHFDPERRIQINFKQLKLCSCNLTKNTVLVCIYTYTVIYISMLVF